MSITRAAVGIINKSDICRPTSLVIASRIKHQDELIGSCGEGGPRGNTGATVAVGRHSSNEILELI